MQSLLEGIGVHWRLLFAATQPKQRAAGLKPPAALQKMQTPRGLPAPVAFFLSGAVASDAARPRTGAYYGYDDAALIIGPDGGVHRDRLSPALYMRVIVSLIVSRVKQIPLSVTSSPLCQRLTPPAARGRQPGEPTETGRVQSGTTRRRMSSWCGGTAARGQSPGSR